MPRTRRRSERRILPVPLGEPAYLAVGVIASAAAGGALVWLAMWILNDHLPMFVDTRYRPPFRDTLGAVLAESSRGLFTGAGLMGSLVILRLLRAIGRRPGKP